MDINYLERVMKQVVDSIGSNDWSFPKQWTDTQKISFIDDAIQYLEQSEMYEQCEKLYEIKKKIKI